MNQTGHPWLPSLISLFIFSSFVTMASMGIIKQVSFQVKLKNISYNLPYYVAQKLISINKKHVQRPFKMMWPKARINPFEFLAEKIAIDFATLIIPLYIIKAIDVKLQF